jgi:hypothetical protein
VQQLPPEDLGLELPLHHAWRGEEGGWGSSKQTGHGQPWV